MTFNEYQREAMKTAIYPKGLHYPVLGLTEEAGEVAGKLAKIIRDKGGEITTDDKVAIGKELGDVLWMCAAIAEELGFSLESVAEANILKLASRQERGVISGSGDNR